MARKSKEELIVAYSGIAARQTAPYDPNATPEQAEQGTRTVRAADRHAERLRTGHIE
jgi:hypothetical protein